VRRFFIRCCPTLVYIFLIREEEVKRWTDSDDERDDKETESRPEGQPVLRAPDADIELTMLDSDVSLTRSEHDPYAMES
jgi:hypothetical protein